MNLVRKRVKLQVGNVCTCAARNGESLNPMLIRADDRVDKNPAGRPLAPFSSRPASAQYPCMRSCTFFLPILPFSFFFSFFLFSCCGYEFMEFLRMARIEGTAGSAAGLSLSIHIGAAVTNRPSERVLRHAGLADIYRGISQCFQTFHFLGIY